MTMVQTMTNPTWNGGVTSKEEQLHNDTQKVTKGDSDVEKVETVEPRSDDTEVSSERGTGCTKKEATEESPGHPSDVEINGLPAPPTDN